MMDILSTEEIIKHANLEIPKRMKEIPFLFLLLLPLTFGSEMKT